MSLLKPRTRALWLRLHRWLGLGLGAVFVMFGLTGSLLVFYVGIDEASLPALARPQARLPMPPHNWQAVLQALQQAHPQRQGSWRIELAPSSQGLVTARYLKPVETADAFYQPLLVTVDATTGQVLASRFWGHFAATWVYDLHYMLLAGETGQTVVGMLGLLMLVSLAGGLVLWWPRPGHWRAALRLKLTGSRQRRHYDLHKLAGVGGGLVLLVLAATGAALALPTWVEPPLARLSPPLPMPSPKAVLQPGVPLLTLDQVLERARAHWPESVPRWVDTPPAQGAIHRLRLWLPGGPSERFPRSYLWIHAQTGEVLAERDARQQSAGDAVLAWLHPLHNGEAFGLPGRLLVCAAGLLPLLLMVTGVQRWADRRRAQRARQAGAATLRRRDGPGRPARPSASAAAPDPARPGGTSSQHPEDPR